MSNGGLAIVNGVILTPFDRVTPGAVVVQEDKIKSVCRMDDVGTLTAGAIVDAQGDYIVPGFVDIHVHGGGGAEFMEATDETINQAAFFHAKHGVTSLVPTLASAAKEDLLAAIEEVRACAARGWSGPELLGIHLEGPYLNPAQRGPHLKEALRDPDASECSEFLRAARGFLAIVTLAPELAGGTQLVQQLRRQGVVAAMGHTNASHGQILEAVQAGLTHSTHFGCWMGGAGREPIGETAGLGFSPGPMETVLTHQGLTTEIITDGCHLHPAIVKLLTQCVGPERACLASNAGAPTGLPDGEYTVSGEACVVEKGVGVLKFRPDVLAWGFTPMDGLIEKAVTQYGLSLHHALQMATSTPARILGVGDRKGMLREGYDADVAIMSSDFRVRCVTAKGKVLYETSD